MNFWWILQIFDGILFFIAALTVLYFLVFSIIALFYRQVETPRAKRQNRFIIIIPAYKKDNVVLQTVNSVLGQTYPQRLFDVVVISDHQSEMTNMRLAQLPVTLLTPDFDESSKAKSMQYAILNLPQFKIYDAVLVLDADNLIESEFLEHANDIYEAAGTKAIQVHRLSRNRDTSVSRLDSIFEEINNAVFRRGQNAIGMSASINGSGILFDYEWFKEHIMRVRTQGEDKELETMLLHEGIFIDYTEAIHVYDEKTRTLKDFSKQRGRWITTQLHALVDNIRLLPGALINRKYDFINKMIQWLFPPRMILMGMIVSMGGLLPFVYFSLAFKWWALGAILLFAYSLATPNYLVDKNWNRDFLLAPVLIGFGMFHSMRAFLVEIFGRFLHLWRHLLHIISSFR